MTSKTSLASPIKWYGGKGRMKNRIIPLLPYTHTYTEAFAGGASIFFDIAPRRVEVLNDLDDRIVNLYRVLQDPQQIAELQQRLDNTLYSFSEFKKALHDMDQAESDMLRAWAFIVVHRIGFGVGAHSEGQWARGKVNASNVASWRASVEQLQRHHMRLRTVQVDSRDACDFLHYWDNADALHYLDPPYAAETRTNSATDYRHDTSTDLHERLVECMLSLRGGVALSGYNTPLYDPLIQAGWEVFQFDVVSSAVNSRQTDGKRSRRTECVWRNPRCLEQVKATEGSFANERPHQGIATREGIRVERESEELAGASGVTARRTAGRP